MYFVHTYTGIDSWIQDAINTFCEANDVRVHTVTFEKRGYEGINAIVMFEKLLTVQRQM